MPISGQTIKSLVKLPQDLNDCWIWTGSFNQKTGYGKKTVDGQTVLAHRWMYETIIGTIPKDMVVNHNCSNRRCVNPAHLEVVTQRENCRHGIGTKLTPIKAKTIKRLLPHKVRGLRKVLASRYNVSEQLISDIWYGRAWKEL